MKKWTRSETLALAKQACAGCFGLGILNEATGRPCCCVLRKIFRVCLDRYQTLLDEPGYLSRIDLEKNRGRKGRVMYSRPKSEYLADFELVGRRALGAGSRGDGVFRLHYLLGLEWTRCAWRLGLSRGNFFHECYRVEAKVGRAFRETRPFALFPLDEYFGGTYRREPIVISTPARAVVAARFPLALAA